MNIYQIQQELISIFDEIEENGGEITPELLEKLVVQQGNFKEKIENYTKAIKLYEADLEAIKVEQKRLKDLADRKQKTINSLTNVIISAVENFGDSKKSGAKFVDFGTGSVSIRQNKSVEVDDTVLDNIKQHIAITMASMRENNQLDVIDRLNSENLIHAIETDYEDSETNIHGINITEDDLIHTNVKLTIKVPTKELLDGKAYPIIRELAKHNSYYDVETSVAKSEIKKELEENGACAPNLAHIVINKSISIK